MPSRINPRTTKAIPRILPNCIHTRAAGYAVVECIEAVKATDRESAFGCTAVHAVADLPLKKWRRSITMPITSKT